MFVTVAYKDEAWGLELMEKSIETTGDCCKLNHWQWWKVPSNNNLLFYPFVNVFFKTLQRRMIWFWPNVFYSLSWVANILFWASNSSVFKYITTLSLKVLLLLDQLKNTMNSSSTFPVIECIDKLLIQEKVAVEKIVIRAKIWALNLNWVDINVLAEQILEKPNTGDRQFIKSSLDKFQNNDFSTNYCGYTCFFFHLLIFLYQCPVIKLLLLWSQTKVLLLFSKFTTNMSSSFSLWVGFPNLNVSQLTELSHFCDRVKGGRGWGGGGWGKLPFKIFLLFQKSPHLDERRVYRGDAYELTKAS